MSKINFSNADVKNVFAATDYNEFSSLMFDTAMGKEKVSKEDANAKIREVMFSVLGIDENSSRKEIHKAIRRHKVDVFEVIEETVENLLVSGWGENPFFEQFVEMKSMADGDTNEFYVQDEMILTVAEVSGNHTNLLRQKLNEGSIFHVKTGYLALKIYTDYELFMAGRIDWASFVQRLYKAMSVKVESMLYNAVMDMGNKVTPAGTKSQFIKTIDFSATDAAKAAVITLVEDVEAATGKTAMIMGTRSSLAKLTPLSNVQWVSEKMKDEQHTTGRLGVWEGIQLCEIPVAFDINTTNRVAGHENKLFVVTGNEKFIKLYNEGESMFKEVSDNTTNQDMTIEALYMIKMGIATVINSRFGMITIS